ncbi:cardiolipin synthase [Devriesea agamarum]|uniref:cardiolipin synthase n=1 Tax=Devriesea agamarum TaxID=472569 RepID=UPI0038B36BBF
MGFIRSLFFWLPGEVVVVVAWAALLLDVTLRLVALIVVPRNRRPGSAIAWLFAIFIFPIIGFPLYLMLGKAQLPRKRRRKQRSVTELMRERSDQISDAELDLDTPSWLQSAIRLNRELGAFPLTGNNSADLFTDYDHTIMRMAEDVVTAEKFVHVEFYTASYDDITAPFFEALAQVRSRGVPVRVLYDHLGSVFRKPGYRRMRKFLDRIGAEHYPMMPFKPFSDGAFQRPDLRNHRKILVIDGQVGWVGSQNLIARHYDKRANKKRGLKWQETMGRFRGPIVSELNLLFGTDWFFESGETLPMDSLVVKAEDTDGAYECQLVPSGPGYVEQNNLLLFNQLFYSAQHKITAVSPYFVPDESMLAALVTAARRGVEVELFVSEIGDQFLVFHAQRSYYEGLLAAGVKIQLYREPYILHAKHLTVDDSVAVLGSSNMDMRSFLLDMESSLMIGGRDFMEKMHEVERQYRAASRELTLEEWRARPRLVKYLDNLCRLASAIV